MIEQDFEVNYNNLSRYDHMPYEQKTIKIIGLVSPKSQGGWYKGNDCTIHNFSFFAWKEIADSKIVTQAMTLLRPVNSNKTNYSYFKEIPKLSVIKCELFVNTEKTRAIFISGEILDNNNDFQDIINKFNEPFELETNLLGKLTLDKATDWFSGKTVWLGSNIEIGFEDLGEETYQEILDTAKILFASQLEWNEKLVEYAKNELLDIKNEHWLEEDEKEVTPEQFKSRMVLKSVSLQPNKRFNFCFDDGDLFWGHGISVYGSVDGGIIGADI
jgi:hypothetical protein